MHHISSQCASPTHFYSAGGSERYKSWLWYVIFMIVVYPVLIPVSYLAVLAVYRRDIIRRNKDSADDALRRRIAPLSFLWYSYEPKFWWWEVVEMLRKLLLTGLIAIFGTCVCDHFATHVHFAGMIMIFFGCYQITI